MSQHPLNQSDEFLVGEVVFHRVDRARHPHKVIDVLRKIRKSSARFHVVDGVIETQNDDLARVEAALPLVDQFLKQGSPQTAGTSMPSGPTFQIALLADKPVTTWRCHDQICALTKHTGSVSDVLHREISLIRLPDIQVLLAPTAAFFGWFSTIYAQASGAAFVLIGILLSHMSPHHYPINYDGVSIGGQYTG